MPSSRHTLIFFALAFVFLAAGLGLRSPWPADEPRFALVARDMVTTGNWLFPIVGSELYQDKPPLFFWMIAAVFRITGSLRFAFLVPSLLAAMGTLWLVYDLGRRWWNRRVGLIGAAALLVTMQFTLQAKRAQIDMTLCFFATLAIYGLARHLRSGPRWGWYLVGFAAMGAGVITKGVGFLPVFMLVPFAWAVLRDWPETTRSRSWKWALGPVAMLAVISAWLVPMLMTVAGSGDPALTAYRDEILLKQTAGRYANPWHHIRPFWYFVVEVIPALWLPLSIAIPWLVPRWWQSLKSKDLRTLLLVGWAALTLLFFSASPGKRGVYILIILPAVALASAPWIDELWDRRGPHRIAFAITTVLTTILLGAAALNAMAPPPEAVETARELGVSLTPFLVSFGLAGLAALLIFRVRNGVASFIAFLLSIWLIVSLWLAPAIDAARSGRMIIENLEQILDSRAELGLVAWREQFLLYIDRPVNHFGHRRFDWQDERLDAIAWMRAKPDRRLMIDDETKDRCFGSGEIIGDAHGARWFLVSEGDTLPKCVDPGRSVTVYRYSPPH